MFEDCGLSSGMSDYKELDVWKKSVEVVTEIYRITGFFPADEKFGITNQMRRAAVSIPSNIAEGSARHHAKDFIHFLQLRMDLRQSLKRN
jgi:hypothetical protein